ncbi:hypothetical protein Tco_1294986 [Tanacetum coccineum]
MSFTQQIVLVVCEAFVGIFWKAKQRSWARSVPLLLLVVMNCFGFADSDYVIESQQAVVQNSNYSAQQDALILSVIEQLKTQVFNCTKINLDNKSVNDTLTAELERYKEQVKVLKEGQNVDLKSNDNVSDSSAQSVEIDRLKQTLSEHLKENESLMQTVTFLKNNFKKEESRNIDREIALEKKIKQLKAQQLESKLYDGNVIKNTSAIVIPNSEETLILTEESRSKMILKQQDPMMLEKKNSLNSSEPTPSGRPTKVEVPKKLPKVSMVNTSLKKLKHHLAGFDVVVKEKTTATTITEGTWGFEHTKAVEQQRLESKTFEVKMNQVLNENDRLLEQVISKDIVDIIVNSSMDNACVNEIFQRDNSVSNQSAPSFDQYFELNELKAQSQEKDTVIIKLKERIKSLSGKMNEDKIKKDLEEIETINIELDHRVSKLIAENEHLKQTYKQLYDSIKPARIRSKGQCDEKVSVITTLNNELRKFKGKAVVDNDVTKHTIDPEMLKIDVEPITPKLLNPRTTHSAYIKHTQEEATVLRDLVEHVKSSYPLVLSLESTLAVTPKNKDKRVRFTEQITSSGNPNIVFSSNLVSNKPVLSSTGVRPSTSASGSQSPSNIKKDKIMQTSRSTLKNKVESHPRTVKSSLKNKNSVVKSKGNANVQHSKLNANSEPLCVKCNGCMLSDNHDLCVLDFINDVDARAKSKFVKKKLKRKA